MGLLSSYAVNRIMHLCVVHLSGVNCSHIHILLHSDPPEQDANAMHINSGSIVCLRKRL